jgi:hypothetical protein
MQLEGAGSLLISRGMAMCSLAIGVFISSASQASDEAAAPLRAAWNVMMSRVELPGKGCFTADYPSTKWRRTGCVAAPDRPFEPAHGPAVGFGNDYAATVSNSVSSATGRFPTVSGLTSERSAGISNQYSLQMNVPYFSSPACASSPDPSGCRAWQQFVFSQAGGKNGESSAFMVYWLINYAPYCPSGWHQAALNCWIASDAIKVPEQKLSALGGLRLTGSAVSDGDDTVRFTTSKKAYAVSAADSMLALAGNWRGTEFNILGNGAGSQANFNPGTQITVNIELTDGSKTAPICRTKTIFTYETNNLDLDSCSGKSGRHPSITFTESN